MVTRERAELAELLGTLTEVQWNTESLCVGWRVRDVAAHLLYEVTPPLTYALETLRAGGSSDRLNARYVERWRDRPIDELLAAFDTTRRGGFPTRFAPRIALADTLIHHQDIRRPLGLHRTVPAPHLLMLLRHPDPFLRPGARMRGLRFAATDVDWGRGSGPTVEGPGEAIVLAVAGRSAALADLGGAGVDILRGRLG
ncbi:maleylpyruvate isomerase family mycothiol-dependent enzyme [Nocardia sp. NPDC006044]|uniref:maleylpyruvate isomerase family mycothiol-dependent enzyme n=1 Tax=Nocardia sp. NPDC006044 TaxID=3364306 RepID=UPI0036C6BCD4